MLAAIVKTLLFILIFCVPAKGFSQNDLFIRRIDSIVSIIARDSSHIEKFRWRSGSIEYSTKNGAFAKIIDSYKTGLRQVIVTFYILDSTLIFATKHATSFYLYGDDIVLLGKYYFEKKALKYYSLFHDEEDRDINQIQEKILAKYDRARSAILIYQKRRNGGKHTSLPHARLANKIATLVPWSSAFPASPGSSSGQALQIQAFVHKFGYVTPASFGPSFRISNPGFAASYGRCAQLDETPMAKRKNLKGIPHNFTKSFFGTERYYSRGYMGDWLSNAAKHLNLKEATLDVMTARFTPSKLNLRPLNLNAEDLKSIIRKELIGNGFESDFISEAKIKFHFLEGTKYKRTILCFPYMVDKEGRRYESDKIIEDVFEIHFDPFDVSNLFPTGKSGS